MAGTRVDRRLAAIFAADVVRYSRLMGWDEEGTHAALKAHRKELFDPKISEHRGRVVKTTGDGALVEFYSAVDAIRCAMEIQRAMAVRNASIPDDRRIEFRIGINVGDIIIDEDDIYGDGVNIAARVEALATPGGICLTENAYQQIIGKLAFNVSDMGEHQLKNIAQPVCVYGIDLEGVIARPALLSDKPSIAVLAFQNISGDPEQDYFCDGMVEDIITGLSRVTWLFVIARNSSFIYKGRNVELKQIGRELGVRYILEGSVRKVENRVRITAQLVEAITGAHLWAERYDRPLDDVFALQDDIAMCVVGAIEPNLRKVEIERVKRQRPSNINAYDLVLRALPLCFTRSPDDAAKAIPLLKDALKLEPEYAAAHAFLSWCLHARFWRGGLHNEDRIAAREHAHAAVLHGSDDATALAAAAFIIALDEHDIATALKAFDRALELSNSNIFALSRSAQTLAFLGKTELAIERAQLALRLSPFDSWNYMPHHAMAISYFHTHRYAEAVDAERSAINSNPNFGILRAVLAASLLRLGRIEEARAAAEEARHCDPSWTIGRAQNAIGLEPQVFRPLADAWREVGLPE